MARKKKEIKIISEKVRTEFKEVEKEKSEEEETLEEEISGEETGEFEAFTDFVSEAEAPILQITGAEEAREPLDKTLENVPSTPATSGNMYETNYSERKYSEEKYSLRGGEETLIKSTDLFIEEQRERTFSPIIPRKMQNEWEIPQETAGERKLGAEKSDKGYETLEDIRKKEKKLMFEKRRRIRA